VPGFLRTYRDYVRMISWAPPKPRLPLAALSQLAGSACLEILQTFGIHWTLPPLGPGLLSFRFSDTAWQHCPASLLATDCTALGCGSPAPPYPPSISFVISQSSPPVHTSSCLLAPACGAFVLSLQGAGKDQLAQPLRVTGLFRATAGSSC
jgi:hypothetical protein